MVFIYTRNTIISYFSQSYRSFWTKSRTSLTIWADASGDGDVLGPAVGGAGEDGGEQCRLLPGQFAQRGQEGGCDGGEVLAGEADQRAAGIGPGSKVRQHGRVELARFGKLSFVRDCAAPVSGQAKVIQVCFITPIFLCC